jgi:hypothetical protein
MQTYSIPSLSRQLRADPRRVSRALAGIRPDAVTRGGGARWFLRTAEDALKKHGHAQTGSAAPLNGSDGSSRGNGSDPIGALEEATTALEEALDKLAAEPDIKKRRAQARIVGPAWVRFNELLDRSAEVLPSPMRELTQPARAKMRALVAGAIMQTLRETLGVRLDA